MKRKYFLLPLLIVSLTIYAQKKITINLNDTSNAATQAFIQAFNQTETSKNIPDYTNYKVNGDSRLTIKGKLLSDAEDEYLKGSVKSIEEYSGKAIMSNININKQKKGTVYDNGDNFVGAFTIDGKVQIDTSKRTRMINTNYDKYGNIERQEWVKNNEVQTCENIYDEENRIICIKIQKGKNKETVKNKYNKEGRISQYEGSKVSYNKDGFVSKYDGKIYEYDIKRDITVLATEKFFGGESITKYYYNNKGLLMSYNNSDIMLSYQYGKTIFGMPEDSYSYDNKDNVIKSNYYIHAYTYDEYGNWIEQFEYHEGSKQLDYYKRVITYYE